MVNSIFPLLRDRRDQFPGGATRQSTREPSSMAASDHVHTSQTRKRYERIGVLVEPAALAAARASMESEVSQ